MGIWLIILVLAILVELITTALVTIWFALGALVAIIICLLGFEVPVQIACFLAVSFCSLILTRPFLKLILPKKYIPTNGELDIGKRAKVIEEINNKKGTGRIEFHGVFWKAVSCDDSIIPIEEYVVIEKKEANTCYVRHSESNDQNNQDLEKENKDS